MRNFKRFAVLTLLLAFVIGVNSLLSFALYPYTYSRVDIHNLISEDHDTIFVGSSHGKCGLNPEVFDSVCGTVSTNQCLGGEYPIDAYHIVRLACETGHKPKQVIYELDAGYFVTEPNEGADFAILYEEFPASFTKLHYWLTKILDGDFRSTLFPWYLYRGKLFSLKDTIASKTGSEYKNYGISSFANPAQIYHSSGFIERLVQSSDKSVKDTPVLYSAEDICTESERYFNKLAEFCREEGIRLIAVTTPVPEVTTQEHSSAYEGADQYFTALTKAQGVEYYNCNYTEEFSDLRDLNYYVDYDGHYYGTYANLFTERFAKSLAGRASSLSAS